MFEDVITTLDAVVDALNTANVAYALCGGLAVNLHGHVRATRDIDLLLPRAQLDAARAALSPLGFGIDAGPIPLVLVPRASACCTECLVSSVRRYPRSI